MRWLLLILLAMPAHAETLVATRTIRPQAILAPGDMTLVAADLPGGLSDPGQAIGREARVAIYAGRPIRAADIGPPTVVDRNQIVSMVFAAGGLAILTEGRALSRGGAGDVIRVMNLASRVTVSGRIQADGSVAVGAIN